MTAVLAMLSGRRFVCTTQGTFGGGVRVGEEDWVYSFQLCQKAQNGRQIHDVARDLGVPGWQIARIVTPKNGWPEGNTLTIPRKAVKLKLYKGRACQAFCN